MSTFINQQLPSNLPPTRARAIMFTQTLNSTQRKTQRDLLPLSENRKNLKSKNNHVVLEQIKFDDSKENSLQKLNTKSKQINHLLHPNKEFLTASPFNNLSNFKNHHLDPLDSNTIKNQLFGQNFIQKQASQNNPNLGQKQRQICQKIYQKKLTNLPQTKRKSMSHRIHITSSKQKQNNSKKNNQDRLSLYNQAILNLKFKTDSKQAQQKEIQQIEDKIFPSLVSSRQRSSNSFLIRKKIASASAYGPKNDKNIQKPNTLPSNFRKDRFIKEENQYLISESIEENVKSQNINNSKNIELINKNQTQEVEIVQQVKRLEEKQQRTTCNKGKSIKVRKGKYSKVQEISTEKEVVQKNHQKQLDKKSRFRSTIQDYLQIKKVHQLQNKRNKAAQNTYEKSQKKQKKQRIQDEKDFKNFQNIKKEEFKNQPIIEKDKQVLPVSKQGQKQSLNQQQQSKHLTNSQIRLCKKRVSSIRALKNCLKNLQTQEQTQFQTDSRIPQPTKRKQKQVACLTHKIKWGTHSRKKSNSEKGIQFGSHLITEIAIEEKISQKKIKDHLIQQKSDQIQKSKQKPKKQEKKLRFSDQIEEMIISSPEKQGIMKFPSKKDSSLCLQRGQNVDQVQSIGSRSLIVFDDPGISIIVRKDSCSGQSSELQPCYNTLDFNIQGDPCLQNDLSLKERKYNINKKTDSARLESLRQLFIELKSHNSIHIPEEKQSFEVDQFHPNYN